MNGGIIDTGVTVTFGDAEGVIYTSSEGSINAAIAGTAGLTLFGPGTLVLGADNSSTLSGTINVNAGTLVAAVDGATGPSGGVADIVNVNTGATLEVPLQGVVQARLRLGSRVFSPCPAARSQGRSASTRSASTRTRPAGSCRVAGRSQGPRPSAASSSVGPPWALSLSPAIRPRS